MDRKEFSEWDDSEHDQWANMQYPECYELICKSPKHVNSLYTVLDDALKLAVIDYQRQIQGCMDAKFIKHLEVLQQMALDLQTQLYEASSEARYAWMRHLGVEKNPLDD